MISPAVNFTFVRVRSCDPKVIIVSLLLFLLFCSHREIIWLHDDRGNGPRLLVEPLAESCNSPSPIRRPSRGRTRGHAGEASEGIQALGVFRGPNAASSRDNAKREGLQGATDLGLPDKP